MDGFPTQNQYWPTHLHCRQRVPLLLAGITVAVSLCMNSGCATMQGAKKDLHLATCGEAHAPCACSCGECTAQTHAGDETIVHSEHVSSRHAAGRHNLVIAPQGQNRPVTPAVQPKMMTIEGMPGIWTPEESINADSGVVDSPATAFNNDAHASRNSRQAANEQFFGSQALQGNSSVPFGQTQSYQGATCPPDVTRNDNELKECRTQIQVLSQQISQMMQSQDSMKVSQETLQQSHQREMLEMNLQQATADRDRLEREREMDRELQKQRERDLKTIDSFSQIIESVAQTPAPQVSPPSDSHKLVPRTSTQSQQGPSKPSELLPAVDESR